MNDAFIHNPAANESDMNRDPLTGAPGAHPVGSGAGAASGGIAGAAVGTALAGPVGAMIGAVVGAVAGGLAGKSAAEVVNPTAEEMYWRETYLRQPYYVKGRTFEYYAPGFRSGWEGRVRHDGRSFEEAENDLKNDYAVTRGSLDPDWIDLREAARAAWTRVDRAWKAEV